MKATDAQGWSRGDAAADGHGLRLAPVRANGFAVELARARLALEAGLTDRAAAALERLLVDAPGHSEAIIALATARLAQGQAEAAVKLLDRHDLYHPGRRDEPALALLRTTALAAAGEVEAAGAWSDRLAEQYADDVRVRRMAGTLASATGRREAAIAHLRSAVRLTPGDSDARLALAQACEATSPDLAIATLASDRALTRQATICRWLARLCATARRCREAEDWLREAVAIDARDGAAWRELGRLADASGGSEAAIACHRRALSAGAATVTALPDLARALMHDGQFGPAARVWLRMAQAGHDRATALAGIAACGLAARPGRDRLVRRVMTRFGPLVDTRTRRALMARQWIDAAMGLTVRRAVEGRRVNEGMPERDAIVMRPLRDLVARARSVLQRASQARPDHADKWHHLAVCASAAGDVASAREAVSRALAINPRYLAAARLAAQLKQAA